MVKGSGTLQARARDKDLREREAQLRTGSSASSRAVAKDSALEQREAALAEREAAMARASAAAEYARSEAETLWRNHKASFCLAAATDLVMLQSFYNEPSSHSRQKRAL